MFVHFNAFACILLGAFHLAQCFFTYDLEFANTDIFSKCEEYPDSYMENYIDLSGLTFELLDNDTIHVAGVIHVRQDIPDNAQLNINLYKQQRGVWINTIYSMHRESFCQALFGTTEIWSDLTRNIPREQTQCPIKAGLTVDLDILTYTQIQLPDSRAAGLYKIIGSVSYGKKPNEFFCAVIIGTLHRI